MTLRQLEELYLTRQSCRSFSEKPVTKELLAQICSLAALAPSACNLQPWRVYAATGEKVSDVRACLQINGKNKFLDTAPAFLVLAKDTPAGIETYPKGMDFTAGDAGIFTAYLLLAAQTLGLSSCVIGWRDEETLKNLLKIPQGWSVPHAVAVGFAADGDPVRPKRRKPLDEVLFFAD